jgi:predicted nuclease of predicted toxin-antitoxin system
VRFLIDECLSTDLVTVAGESGHEARHVAHVGRAGWKDWNVTRYARDNDLITWQKNDEAGMQRLPRALAVTSNSVFSAPRVTSSP